MPLYRKITFLVYPKFEALDLSGPCSAFNLAKDIYHVNYEIEIVSSTAGMVEDRAGIRIETHPFHDVGLNETVIVVGGPTALIGEIDNETKTFLEESKLRGKQVASVCTGAFLLAEAGILQGRRATHIGAMPAFYKKSILRLLLMQIRFL